MMGRIKAPIQIIKYGKNSWTTSDGWEGSLAPPSTAYSSHIFEPETYSSHGPYYPFTIN